MESAMKNERPRMKAVWLNNGRTKAQIETAVAHEGTPTVRVKVASQCPLDSYRRRGWITTEEWRVGERFLQLCHSAAIDPQFARVEWRERVDATRVPRHGPSDRQQAARGVLHRIERSLGRTPSDILRSVLVERKSAAAWARERGFRETSGMDFLRDALSTLGELLESTSGVSKNTLW